MKAKCRISARLSHVMLETEAFQMTAVEQPLASKCFNLPPLSFEPSSAVAGSANARADRAAAMAVALLWMAEGLGRSRLKVVHRHPA